MCFIKHELQAAPLVSSISAAASVGDGNKLLATLTAIARSPSGLILVIFSVASLCLLGGLFIAWIGPGLSVMNTSEILSVAASLSRLVSNFTLPTGLMAPALEVQFFFWIWICFKLLVWMFLADDWRSGASNFC